MKRPFIYGELAEDENFIDRIEDRKQLKTFLGNGVNVTLISPRRWGKSSLVKATMKEMQAENSNMVVCFIDAFRLNSEKDFYNAFASAVVIVQPPLLTRDWSISKGISRTSAQVLK